MGNGEWEFETGQIESFFTLSLSGKKISAAITDIYGLFFLQRRVSRLNDKVA